ncbi:MAG: DUF4339 domain-containing protein [Parachlamydiaceae bacterium]
MDKVWYIWFDSKKLGPYSYNDLKKLNFVTPDTLVWKKGMKEWLPIRKVAELKDLFKDENEIDLQEEDPSDQLKAVLTDEVVIQMEHVDPPFFLWFLIALLILLFLLFRLN